MGISDKAVAYLKARYGDHEFNYIMSDHNLNSLLNEGYDTYEDFDRAARALDRDILYIREMQEKMNG